MADTFASRFDLIKEKNEMIKNLDENVPQDLQSKYQEIRKRLKEIIPERQAELNVINQKYDVEKKALFELAEKYLQEMKELTDISTLDLCVMLGGYNIHD
tara:strand:+ start:104 stop:403 length:300 start_codon:yes stop_codon:yes gene_type:complete